VMSQEKPVSSIATWNTATKGIEQSQGVIMFHVELYAMQSLAHHH
jgi:hypothetical protein